MATLGSGMARAGSAEASTRAHRAAARRGERGVWAEVEGMMRARVSTDVEYARHRHRDKPRVPGHGLFDGPDPTRYGDRFPGGRRRSGSGGSVQNPKPTPRPARSEAASNTGTGSWEARCGAGSGGDGCG